MRIDQLQSMPGHLVRRAQQTITALFAETMGAYDLTSVQFIALVAIDDVAQLDATRLAELICVDKATIGGVVERLERKGLIRRTTSPDDRRAKHLVTTPAGKAMITVCYDQVVQVQADFLAPLSDAEQAEFVRLLDRVAAGRSKGQVGSD